MLDLNKLSRPAGRAEFLRDVRIVKACDESIVKRLASPAEAREIELEVPIAHPEITDGRPVRRVINRTTVGWSGYLYSAKNGTDGEMMPWESFNERRGMIRCECDSRVTAYLTQPFTIRFPWIHGYNHYTPDLYVVMRDGRVYVVEIGGAGKLEDPVFRLRKRLWTEWCARRNVIYELWLEQHLKREPRFSNMELLLRYRGFAVSAQTELAIREHLRKLGTAPIQEIARIADPRGVDAVLTLLLNGVLAADIESSPLNGSTLVRLFGEAA